MSPATRPPHRDLSGDDPDRPIYSIGTVARMVGVPAATIRTWEERYEGVVPTRDVSGRRLYSRRQVSRLRFVKDQVDQGLQPSEAHRLLDGQEEPGAMADTIEGSGLRLPQLRFLAWVLENREAIRGLMSELRHAVEAPTAFVQVNVPHPEYGLTSSLMVRSTTAERMEGEQLAGLVGVAWSRLPEVAGPLSRGESMQFRLEELGPSGRDLYRPTDIRSQLAAPLHHEGQWLAGVGIADTSERTWNEEEQGLVERARDLLLADFAASEARARFGRLVHAGTEAEQEEQVGNGTTGAPTISS